MKRYVKELAADYLRSLAGSAPARKEQEQERINRILYCCNRGNLTDFEAVQEILRLTKEA